MIEINIKDIWRDSKKYCIICEEEKSNNGIKVIDTFICQECMDKMNFISIDSDEYDFIKNKINMSLSSKILEFENLD